jgi:hypothetical protein
MTGVPLDRLTEDELVSRAQAAMDRAVAAGRGTLGWAVQWAVYDTYASELERRAISFVATRFGRPDQ